MELECKFFQDALPTTVDEDPAIQHLRNCSDCQGQVYVVDESMVA